MRTMCASGAQLEAAKVPTALTGLGLVEDRTTVSIDGKRATKRFYKCIFPDSDEPQPVGFASE